MQEFFINYGLYLLIALLVVIAVMFLLTRKPTGALPGETPVETPVASALDPAPAPIVEAPAQPLPEVEAVVVPPIIQPVAPVDDAADDLLKLKGVGAKLNALLIELGVTRYAQIAAWTDADVAAIDAKLGAFKGRPTRDQWIDQAKLLAAGDIAGFEARYGKI
jgi:predicted flap endonuclease-1-like 5' DNA nuclease